MSSLHNSLFDDSTSCRPCINKDYLSQCLGHHDDLISTRIVYRDVRDITIACHHQEYSKVIDILRDVPYSFLVID